MLGGSAETFQAIPAAPNNAQVDLLAMWASNAEVAPLAAADRRLISKEERESLNKVLELLPLPLARVCSQNLALRMLRGYWNYSDREATASAALANTIQWRLDNSGERFEERLNLKKHTHAHKRPL
jgi:hypothetical protein